MKTVKALILIFVLGPGPISLAQELDTIVYDLQFYERLAQRDAAYERELRFSNEKDEQDYWDDQKNFEQLLLQKNPKAYQVYISNKGPSYIEHIQQCQKECTHGDLYRREVSSFLLEASRDSLYGRSLSVTNSRKNLSDFK